MLRLYDSRISANAYKVRLLLAQLEIPYERVDVDWQRGAARSDAFQAINPAGQVPVLRLEDGSLLPESNAILWYLAHGTPLLPRSVRMQSEVLRWMFFEQNAVEPNLGRARRLLSEAAGGDADRAAIAECQQRAASALKVLERHLESSRFMVAGAYSIADIALYALVHLADEAGIQLREYPAVRHWLDRVAVEPQHIESGDLRGTTVRE